MRLPIYLTPVSTRGEGAWGVRLSEKSELHKLRIYSLKSIPFAYRNLQEKQKS
jgi:hypothetical protein